MSTTPRIPFSTDDANDPDGPLPAGSNVGVVSDVVRKKGTQFDRSVSLIVAKKASNATELDTKALDLSQLRFRFTVKGGDTESPNTLVVRVYNLAPDTLNAIVNEYDQVSLQAGYKNAAAGIVFTGQIKYTRRGRESSTDTFLEISAADYDLGYNFGFVNTTLAPGASLLDVYLACAKAMGAQPDEASARVASLGGVLPRGKVLFNLGRVEMRTLADSLGCRWSIQDGRLIMFKFSSYLPGEVYVLTPGTGLLDIPEATDDGVEFNCLLNPLIKVGTRVQIDSSYITKKRILSQGFSSTNDISYPAAVTTDGVYRVLSIEHRGDTRGDDFTTSVIGLAVSVTTDPAGSVDPFPS